MKHDVFNQYVERVSDLFGVSRDEMFSKSKKRECVDARHLVYYLCNKRPMQITYIQNIKEPKYENIKTGDKVNIPFGSKIESRSIATSEPAFAINDSGFLKKAL